MYSLPEGQFSQEGASMNEKKVKNLRSNKRKEKARLGAKRSSASGFERG